MNLFKLAVIGVVSIYFVSCVGERKTLDSWLEHNIHEAIMTFGPPAQVTSDGSNGKVYVFSQTANNAYNGDTYYHYIFFYAYTDGTIYHWISKRGTIPPQRINVDMYIH
jgi:hypothetical protein